MKNPRFPRFPKSTEVQTVIFPKEDWSVATSKRWLREHGFKASTVDETSNFYRYRQKLPVRFRKETFRTIEIGDSGIKAVIGVPKKSEQWTERLRKNPSQVIVNLGKALELRMVGGTIYRFPSNAKWIVCSSLQANELFILKSTGMEKVTPIRTKRIRDAEKLWSRWSGFKPDEAMTGTIPDKKMLSVGKVDAICYESDKWSGKKAKYIHDFDVPPKAYADNKSNPSIFRITGNLKVKKEGITG